MRYVPPPLPAYLVAMTHEQDAAAEPTAFGLVRMTPEMQQAIAVAYDQLLCGAPNDIEIPVNLPLLPVRHEKALEHSSVPHARALLSALFSLRYLQDRRSCTAGQKVCGAFDQVTAARPAHAVLIVSRNRPPRLRTGIRGGRTRYVSAPLQQLAPKNWLDRPAPGSLRLHAVS